MRIPVLPIIRSKDGAAAVEFSLLVMPFLIIIFGILDIALMFFVDGALDFALNKASREVRTGKASIEGWQLPKFKQRVCDDLALSFDCEDKLLVTTQVMHDFSSITLTNPVKNRALVVKESFAAGDPGDYILIQAFLPWTSWLAPLGLETAHLEDGRYVLAATALFRNEPYEH